MSSSLASGTCPGIALESLSAHKNFFCPLKSSPGMAMSMPARALPTVVCCAFQSLTTYPLNSSSSFSSPLSRRPLSHAHVVLSLLYEHMTLATLAFTASAKGHKYSSCMVRSSMFDVISVRSCSFSTVNALRSNRPLKKIPAHCR